MSGKDVDIEHWSRIAAEWTAWARAPNHDAFWAYRASLVAFIRQGVGDALDVSCGEGRGLARSEGLRLPGHGGRSSRAAHISSRTGWIGRRVQDRGGR